MSKSLWFDQHGRRQLKQSELPTVVYEARCSSIVPLMGLLQPTVSKAENIKIE